MKNTILEFKSTDEGISFVKLPDGSYLPKGYPEGLDDGYTLYEMLNEYPSVKSGDFIISKVQRETDGEIFEIGDSVIHKDAGDISEITKFVYTEGSGFTVVCLGNNIETVIENITKTDKFIEQKDKDHKDRKTADFLTSILALLTGNSKEKPLYESLFKDNVTKTTQDIFNCTFAGRKEINIIAAPLASVRPEINFHVGKTEYGEDVFMGDQYYTVCTKAIEARNWIVNGPYLPVSSFTTIDVTKAFLSKEDAEHYIIGNKPVFSYKDVSKLLGTGNDPIIIPAHLRGRLIQEAEKRIKNQ